MTTDGTAGHNAGNYRVSAFYDLAKSAVLRLAWSQGHELAGYGCTAVALTPGWMRSEMMLENHGVTEANWQDALDQPCEPPHPDPGHFGISETPRFTGRGRRSGRRLRWDLAVQPTLRPTPRKARQPTAPGSA